MTSRTGKGPRATILLLDGARPDVLDRLRAAGDLPHLERHLLGGRDCGAAVTVFPSTTGVAYLPFLTGCYPGTCDVPGIRWLDPRRYDGRWWRPGDGLRSYCGWQGGCLDRDLRVDRPSLFDLVDDALALCTPFQRGLGRERVRVRGARTFWGAVGHYTGQWRALDRAIGRELARTAGRHAFTFAVFPGVDLVTHHRDPFHPDVLRVYREFDASIGAFAAAGGFADDSLVVLASDHGASRVERHTDLALALESFGIPTLRHPLVWRRAPRAAVMVSGNGSAQVYLRPGQVRERRFTAGEIEGGAVEGIPRDLADRIATLPGVALVVAEEAGEGSDASPPPDPAAARATGPAARPLRLVGREGRARLEPLPDGRVRYRPETADVLGLGPEAARTDRAWLEASIDGPFPDAPRQLLQLFRSGRTGDLVVIAGPGSDLRCRWEIPAHRAGHGSLTRDHMRCLVAANRPLPSPLRTVDVFPLVLEHLGIPAPDGIDGVLPAGSRAEPAPALVPA